MFKKFLWLIVAVVFLCSPLWAEENNPWDNAINGYTLAAADKQPEGSQLATSTPAIKSASPTDFCPNTNTCFQGPPIPCALPFSLVPGMVIYTFQDPAKTCPSVSCSKVYPFLVNSIHILMTNCGPAPCTAILKPLIWSAIYPNPNCPTPGTVICQGIEQEVQILPNQCVEIVLPLLANCCVDTSYFASVSIFTTDCPNLQVCIDQSCTPCCNYIQISPQQPIDACQAGSPGDFALWTDGFLSCQNDCVPPPPPIDTLRNHFKTWRIITPERDTFALVRDQFTIYDPLKVDSIDFLSNPTIKDTSGIKRPDDHLTWYKAHGKIISVKVDYVNQFESTSVFIDSVKYLLLPTWKQFPPHNPPDTLLGHYTAYKIRKPKTFRRPLPIQLQDEFDVLFGAPELLDSLKPVYFLTPADKNNELRPKSDTHYVAYEIFPKRVFVTNSVTQDQFGIHSMQIQKSELLLVPSRKDTFVVCTYKPNDCNGDGKIDLADIVCDVNVVFKGFPKPIPNCRCDSDCNGICNLVDIIYKKNYVFGGGPQPVPCKECCIP